MNYKTARMIQLYGVDYLNSINDGLETDKLLTATLIKDQLGIIEAHIHTLRQLQCGACQMNEAFRTNDEYLMDTLKWMVKYDAAQEKDPEDNSEYDESDGTKYEN